VILDFGVNTPGPVPFEAGFTRAPTSNRFTGGDYDETTPPLSQPTGAEQRPATSQADAYRGRLAPASVSYRQNLMPWSAIARPAWLARQPPTRPSTRDSRSCPFRRPRLTWGSYVIGPAQKPTQRASNPRLATRTKRPVERRDGVLQPTS
jgi:hypothetical protein